MTRSYRRTPTFRLCGRGGSERWYKRYHSSRERRAVRDAIRRGDFLLLHFQQARWDEWSTGRDGKMDWWDMKNDKKVMSK